MATKKNLKEKKAEKKPESAKKKILLISDSPYATTGLGRMSKYFLRMLPDYKFVVWGMLHPDHNIRKGVFYPHYNKEDFPNTEFELISPKTYTDNQYGIEYIPDLIKTVQPDFVITSMDYDKIYPSVEQMKQLQFTMEKKFKWINYFPMDREDFKPIEVDGYRFPDVNVCITKFGVDKIHAVNPKIKIHQIYHPLDLSEFPEVDAKELKEFKAKTWPSFPVDSYHVGTVNRSFSRKDTARLVRIFIDFLKRTKDTTAYLHGSVTTAEGLNLNQVGMENEAPKGRMAFLPAGLNEVDGIPQEILNKIYRCLDLFVTVSTGEGFGFSTVEAMACKIPIIAPKNTSFTELVADCGYLIEPSEMAFINPTKTTMWPVVNMEKVIEQMIYVMEHPEETKEKTERAYNFVKDNLNLDKIANQWRKILK